MIETIIFLLIYDLCKYFRLTSAIVLGDETPDNLVPAFRRTSIKGIKIIITFFILNHKN